MYLFVSALCYNILTDLLQMLCRKFIWSGIQTKQTMVLNNG